MCVARKNAYNTALKQKSVGFFCNHRVIFIYIYMLILLSKIGIEPFKVCRPQTRNITNPPKQQSHIGLFFKCAFSVTDYGVTASASTQPPRLSLVLVLLAVVLRILVEACTGIMGLLFKCAFSVTDYAVTASASTQPPRLSLVLVLLEVVLSISWTKSHCLNPGL